MKYLTNAFDPKHDNAQKYVIRRLHQTSGEAWNQLRQYLSDKVIGPPKATEAYTRAELEQQNYVGVYAMPDDPRDVPLGYYPFRVYMA